MRQLRLTILLVALVLSSMISVAADTTNRQFCTVQTVRGQLHVLRTGLQSAVTVGEQSALYAGDTVITGSDGKASLIFAEGTQVAMGADTSIQLSPPKTKTAADKATFRLIRGTVFVRARPGVVAETVSAIAAVRGTRFALNVDAENTSTLTVIEGRAQFYNDLGSVIVSDSQQSLARPGTPPSTPITIENAGVVIEWTYDLDRSYLLYEKFFGSTDREQARSKLQRLSELVRRRGDSAVLLREYGDALFDSGSPDAALGVYTKTLNLQPDDAATLLRIGCSLLLAGRLDNADQEFRQLAARSSGDIRASCLIGLAWSALQHDRAAEALERAREASEVSPLSAEAMIVRAIALTRQPSGSADSRRAHRVEARALLLAATSGNPTNCQYQAHAWLALLLLDSGEAPGALDHARLAVSESHGSDLAHSSLALALFFNSRPNEARKEAEAALRLAPNSVPARIALGQALLAEGNVDSAAHEAAKAVALDPELAQGYYLLGLADAQRRDYSHSIRSLEECHRIAPDFIAAASALARVYVMVGRQQMAAELLQGMQSQYPDRHEVLAALAGVAYENARYDSALALYGDAIRLSPGTARYYAEAARVALDANRLDDSIGLAQKAVQLAPQIGQFHTILGLAYEYSRLMIQAEREYREALSLDPQDAVAIVKLSTGNQEGDPRTALRTTAVTIAQGYLLDPGVSDWLMRGGITTEMSGEVGDPEDAESLTHRNKWDRGKGRVYATADRQYEEVGRPNSDVLNGSGLLNITDIVSPKVNVYAHGLYWDDRRGLPGQDSSLQLDDRKETSFGEGLLAARSRFGDTNHLWVGAFGNRQRITRDNPNRDQSFLLPGSGFLGVPITITDQADKSSDKDLEIRADFATGADGPASDNVTVGAAWPYTVSKLAGRLFLESAGYPDKILDPDNSGVLTDDRHYRTRVAYAEWQHRTGERLSFSAQLRVQGLETTTQRSFVNLTGTTLSFLPDLTVSPPSTDQTRVLPSMVGNYLLDRRTLLRLWASRRVTDVTSSVFAPTDTLLTSEREVFPTGLPETLDILELEVERYIAPGNVLKLIGFKSTARNVQYDLSPYSNQQDLTMDRVHRMGAAVRYETSLSRRLFSHAGIVVSRTTDTTTGAVWNGDAPYHPKLTADLGLNYVDPKGNKAALSINRIGSFLQDGGDPAATARPRFPSKTYVSLTLAREPSVHNEFFIEVDNLFNSRQIAFNDIPVGWRVWRLGWIHRY